MHEQIGLLRLHQPAGKSSPEQNRHIYTKILQNSTSSILSARTSKTNSKTPYELNILQDQRPKLENRPSGSGVADKDFKSIYGSNQLTASIDLKTLNFKNLQETSSNNANNNSADNSRNMRKSLENLNVYTNKPKDKGDKYTELKQSIMSQIKLQNFTGVEENKPSSRENSKSHNTAATSVLSTHKSALNYFSMNQNNKNIKTSVPNQEKPPQNTQPLASNKAFKKLAGQFENAGSPDKRPEVTTSSSNSNWGRNNSHRKEKEKKPENQTHLHSNKAAKLVEKYYETLEKSQRKPAQSGSSKDVASHSFQQGSQNNKLRNPENLNVSDNSVPNSNIPVGKGLEGSMVEQPANNLFDFTLLKSYNEKLSKNHSIEEQEFIRENLKKALADTPPKKREAARSLPATTKNSSAVNFKGSLLNEAALNNRAYNLLKSRREEESKTGDTGFRNTDAGFRSTVEPNKNLIIEQQQKGGPTVKVNDLLNEEFKTNSEMRVKCEKARCEDCETKIAELEAIYEKVKGMFEAHRRKETGWLNEKNHYIRQIEYLNSVIKQIIEKNPNSF